MKDKPVSNTALGHCECCGHVKLVRLYVMQDGNTAWICKECREGKKNGG